MPVNETNLMAALIPKDAMTVHPNMFALQIKYKNMRDTLLILQIIIFMTGEI